MPAAAFDLQGHRGARGLAPENTLAAFRTALDLGVTTLETDLAVTKDDVVVISHDPLLNPDLVRGPDGQWIAPPARRSARSPWPSSSATTSAGSIRRASYAQQFPEQKPADGERFPTLAELFADGGPGRCASTSRSRPIRPKPDAHARSRHASRSSAVEAIRAGQGRRAHARIQSFDWRGADRGAAASRPRSPPACLTIESNNMDTVGRASGRPSPWLGGLDLAAQGGSVPRLAKAAGLRHLVAVLAQRHGRQRQREPTRWASR